MGSRWAGTSGCGRSLCEGKQRSDVDRLPADCEFEMAKTMGNVGGGWPSNPFFTCHHPLLWCVPLIKSVLGSVAPCKMHCDRRRAPPCLPLPGCRHLCALMRCSGKERVPLLGQDWLPVPRGFSKSYYHLCTLLCPTSGRSGHGMGVKGALWLRVVSLGSAGC